MSPFKSVDECDEESCFAILLVHTVWPIEGEIGLINPNSNAISRLQELKANKVLPIYVIPSLQRLSKSAELLSNREGFAATGGESRNDSDNDGNLSEGEISDDSGEDHEIPEILTTEHFDFQNDTTTSINNISARRMKFYSNYIESKQNHYMKTFQDLYSISEPIDINAYAKGRKYTIANHVFRSTELEKKCY